MNPLAYSLSYTLILSNCRVMVSGFLKEKLPSPIAGQIDNVLSGAGGMFGKS